MRSVLTLGLVAVLGITASAQLPTSTLNGTVSDPQGAPVADAKVSIINQATGAVRDTTTDTAGFYSHTKRLPPHQTHLPGRTRFAKAQTQNGPRRGGRGS